MSVHRYNSWGRTRSPKNIAGPNGTAVALEANTNNLRGVTATTAGYSTENQRYLHVLVCDANGSGTPAAITIFGYCHAFQRWFEIEAQTMGLTIANVSDTIDPANTAPTAASITAANSGRAPNVQVPSDREYRVYNIVGVDRVAFVGADDESNVFAACSTF